MIENNLNLQWFAHARVNVVTRDLLRKMKSAGCMKVGYGIESASKEILEISKKNIDLERAPEVFKITKEEGIEILAYFLIGLPGETKKTWKDTIKLAIELDPDTVSFNIATPFPGTELAKDMHKYGKIYGDLASFTNDDALYAPFGMTVKKLQRMSKIAWARFYLRPRFIIKQLKEINSYAKFKETL